MNMSCMEKYLKLKENPAAICKYLLPKINLVILFLIETST